MARALMDTQIFVWLINGERELPPAVSEFIYTPGNEVLLSVASAWELSIKAGLGRLKELGPPEAFVRHWATHYKLEFLPIRLEHVFRVSTLPMHHRDPFDRLLIAQAQVEMVPILSVDGEFPRYDVRLIR